MTETDLLWLAIERAPYVLPHVRVFRRAVFKVKVEWGYAKAGIPGQCDAWAYATRGRVVEIEAKSARGSLEKAQRAWRDQCARLGIPHLVWKARTGEHPDETVSRWLDELGAILPP